jgi:hypothetical protein
VQADIKEKAANVTPLVKQILLQARVMVKGEKTQKSMSGLIEIVGTDAIIFMERQRGSVENFINIEMGHDGLHEWIDEDMQQGHVRLFQCSNICAALNNVQEHLDPPPLYLCAQDDPGSPLPLKHVSTIPPSNDKSMTLKSRSHSQKANIQNKLPLRDINEPPRHLLDVTNHHSFRSNSVGHNGHNNVF